MTSSASCALATSRDAQRLALHHATEGAVALAAHRGSLARGGGRDGGAGLAKLARARTTLPSADDLMPLVRVKLRQIEATIQTDVAQGRLVLGALLGDTRGIRSATTG